MHIHIGECVRFFFFNPSANELLRSCASKSLKANKKLYYPVSILYSLLKIHISKSTFLYEQLLLHWFYQALIIVYSLLKLKSCSKCDFRPLCILMGYSEIVSSSWGCGTFQETLRTILNLELLYILCHPSEIGTFPCNPSSHLYIHRLWSSYFRQMSLPQWWKHIIWTE